MSTDQILFRFPILCEYFHKPHLYVRTNVYWNFSLQVRMKRHMYTLKRKAAYLFLTAPKDMLVDGTQV